MTQAEAKFKEGMDHMKAAEKMISTSFFKWKADYEGGAQEFQQAANCFKNAKALEQAKEAFVRAAEANSKCGYHISAAQNMDNGAMMAKQMKKYEEAASLYERSSNYYQENGTVDKAAETLAKAGETLKEVSVEKAAEYYMSACDLFISEGKEQFAQETFKNTISLLLKSKQHVKALEILGKQIESYLKTDSRPSLFKCYLSSIIICVAMGDPVEANKRCQTYLQTEGFLGSSEGQSANDMLRAIESGNQEELTKITQRHHFNFLEHEVIRVARNLQTTGTGAGDLDEEGLL